MKHSFNDEQLNTELNALRADIIRMAEHSGHVAVALSCVDILAALYFEVLDCSPAEQGNPARNRFVMSKGHGCMALYAVLARLGFFPHELLESYGSNGSILAEHPIAGMVPGVECATGTLGHGLSIGAGMARGQKLQGLDARVFVLLGDGECNEGSVWEAAALASAGGLDNLVAIVDGNGLQACGSCAEISPGTDLAQVWRGFGWEVVEIDGHDYRALVTLLGRAPEGRPLALLCNTIKGRGVDFMEGDLEWHYRPVRGADRQESLKRLQHA
jgi:transketolase